LIEFELWDGALQEQALHRLAQGIVACFLFSSPTLHLGPYIVLLHPLLNSFSLFQTEELEAVDTRLLPWVSVWYVHTVPEEMAESQEWCGGDKGGGVGAQRCVSSPASTNPVRLQVLQTRLF